MLAARLLYPNPSTVTADALLKRDCQVTQYFHFSACCLKYQHRISEPYVKWTTILVVYFVHEKMDPPVTRLFYNLASLSSSYLLHHTHPSAAAMILFSFVLALFGE